MSDDKLGVLGPEAWPVVEEPEPVPVVVRLRPSLQRMAEASMPSEARVALDQQEAQAEHKLRMAIRCALAMLNPAQVSEALVALRETAREAPNSPLRPIPEFYGPDLGYADVLALASLQLRCKAIMQDYAAEGRWITIAEMASLLGIGESSAGARIRALRAKRWGSWEVLRRRVPCANPANGLFEYRLG